MKKNLLYIWIVLFSAQAFAWPSLEETYDLLDILRNEVKCSLSLSTLHQTKEGAAALNQDFKQVLIDNVPVEASSPSRFASFSLSREAEDWRFYFSLNSQTGSLRLYDKVNNFEAEAAVDIYDLKKDWPYLGQVQLTRKEEMMVISPYDAQLVPGEKYTYLRAVLPDT